ncbi:hypothetical protein A2714_02055 [Candidatus Woesebacteria bacterium RIFCSPHIGHO2_01_FULL_38_9]|uniref:Uncharacterized protein n=2 Tax=Candidatus Woeseibacteriota TaxID=1752722 RepID=A0A1F7Y1C3_9BACT|nr:MAG: hypothetical protein A2714_02055 [Candidatus Woesebacteria bacterium RIFCSPHIGHO2_01_FULL_38_9]OGM60180.1 MAG: hypothetical protein A3A75_05775 [Candidatus Woesebacteria bacterium RIFCSPLOWO2_01_FULL_39_10]
MDDPEERAYTHAQRIIEDLHSESSETLQSRYRKYLMREANGDPLVNLGSVRLIYTGMRIILENRGVEIPTIEALNINHEREE